MSSILGPVRPGRKRLRPGPAPGRLLKVSAEPGTPAPQVTYAPPPTPREWTYMMTHVRGLRVPRHTHLCLCTPWPTAPHPTLAHPLPVHTEVPDRRVSVAPCVGILCVYILHVRVPSQLGSALRETWVRVQGRKACSRKPSVHLFRRLGGTRFRREEPVRDRSTQGHRRRSPGTASALNPPNPVPILWLLKPLLYVSGERPDQFELTCYFLAPQIKVGCCFSPLKG